MRKYDRYLITLEAKSPFRIGGEKPIPGTTDVDSPVATVGDKIVVQGTSLKGAFRAELERYLIDSFFDKTGMKWKSEWLRPCIPADLGTITEDEKPLIKDGHYKYCCSYPEQNDYICPICYLLGARGLVGFISVPFLNIETEAISRLQFIRADRVVGTSARGKYGAIGKYEVVPEGVKFSGTMIVLKEDDIISWKLGEPRSLAQSKGDKWLEGTNFSYDKVIKDFMIDRLQSIKFLGGFKSKGCGEVSISVNPFPSK